MDLDSKEKRRVAAEAFAHALHTGEASAVSRARPHLAAGVILSDQRSRIAGRDAVLAHIAGERPANAIYRVGGWSEAEDWGDGIVVRAEFPPFGAGPASLTLAFAFNDLDEITEIENSSSHACRPESTPEIPLLVRAAIDNALRNGTPVVIGYVSEDDEPELTVRGSVRVFGPTQLSVWLRERNGLLARSIRRNPRVSLLYRDHRTRTKLSITGRARVTLDDATCRRVYALAPEVEQHHDVDRAGAALIVDVVEIQGSTLGGGVLVRP